MKIRSLICLMAFAAVTPVMAGKLIVSGEAPFAETSRQAAGAAMPGHGARAAAAAPVFEVLGSDRNIREVLQRWARSANWKFDQVHWTIPRDFPIEGTASSDAFPSDFKDAARALLSSTEGTDMPVQPCFYTNHVVRVVPQAEVCDRALANQ